MSCPKTCCEHFTLGGDSLTPTSYHLEIGISTSFVSLRVKCYRQSRQLYFHVWYNMGGNSGMSFGHWTISV